MLQNDTQENVTIRHSSGRIRFERESQRVYTTWQMVPYTRQHDFECFWNAANTTTGSSQSKPMGMKATAVEVNDVWCFSQQANQKESYATTISIMVLYDQESFGRKVDSRIMVQQETCLKIASFRRFGSPEEVSSAVVWLLCPGASYVTGTVLSVDGASAYTFLPLIEIENESHLPVYGTLPRKAKL